MSLNYKIRLKTKIRQLQAELDKVKAEKEGLKKFARFIIRQECWSIFDQDGGDVQDRAEDIGLIKAHRATEKDIDDESDFEVGDLIYKFSQILKENNGKEGTTE